MKFDLLGLVSWVLRGMLVGFGLLRTSFVCYGEYMYGLGNPYRELFGGIQLGTQLEANMNTYTPIDDVLTLFDVKGNEWDT